MADPYVRKIGHIEDIEGLRLVVGVDYDTVTLGYEDLGKWQFPPAAVEELAQLIVAATWQAGQVRKVVEEFDEAHGGDTAPEGCICGRTAAVCAQAGREGGRG